MQPAIIVAGYKRHKSLNRLLESITNSYFESPVTVVISLDGGFNIETLKVAEKFKHNFSKGIVEIIARNENIGLKNHIIWCGDQSKRFGSVIVLEDDLIVDPQFYNYAKKAADYFEGDKHIAGISLYGQEFNEYTGLPFKPLHNGTSCYFMQIASSWGQLWTAKQWEKFRSWYTSIDEAYLLEIKKLPAQVKAWPTSSWKKFFSGYLAEKELFFAYPYQSFTTNVSDGGGTHIKDGTFLLQTSFKLPNRREDNIIFNKVESIDSVLYDTYMEPASSFIYELLGYNENELAFDLYGSKPLSLLSSYRYAITSKATKNSLRTISLAFRPFENSIFRPESTSTVHVFFTETKNIISKTPKYPTELTEYLTGINLKSTNLARSLIFSWAKKLAQKFNK